MTPTTTSPQWAKLLSLLWLCVAILVTAGSLGCDREKEPIRLGFSGCLTGRLSDLGTSGRNGVILAVEQVNAAGGINGRPVELIVRDDRQDTAEALRVDRELMAGGRGGHHRTHDQRHVHGCGAVDQ
ncbi:MAG: ABC transporter substrate-binding protein [Desulfobacteraceae bacterium]